MFNMHSCFGRTSDIGALNDAHKADEALNCVIFRLLFLVNFMEQNEPKMREG